MTPEARCGGLDLWRDVQARFIKRTYEFVEVMAPWAFAQTVQQRLYGKLSGLFAGEARPVVELPLGQGTRSFEGALGLVAPSPKFFFVDHVNKYRRIDSSGISLRDGCRASADSRSSNDDERRQAGKAGSGGALLHSGFRPAGQARKASCVTQGAHMAATCTQNTH
jgi:hypothetical protein